MVVVSSVVTSSPIASNTYNGLLRIYLLIVNISKNDLGSTLVNKEDLYINYNGSFTQFYRILFFVLYNILNTIQS